MYNTEIRQGATFYREGQIFGHPEGPAPDDATIRGALLTLEGVLVANLLCAWLSRADWTFAVNLPRAITATIDPMRKYLISVNYDQGGNTDPIEDGYVTVRRGPAPPA